MAEVQATAPTRRCTCCGVEKTATEEFFHRHKGGRFGLRAQCRECKNALVRESLRRPDIKAVRIAYAKRYAATGKTREKDRRWVLANKDKVRSYRLKRRDKARERDKIWRDANREKVRAKQRRADAKLQCSPAHVLKKRIKARLRQMLKGTRLGSTENILGYSAAQLREHIERQFSKGMTWDALMRGEIHIDHIIPVSAFNIQSLDDPDFSACWAMTNLRPMWAKENQQKQAKVLYLL